MKKTFLLAFIFCSAITAWAQDDSARAVIASPVVSVTPKPITPIILVQGVDTVRSFVTYVEKHGSRVKCTEVYVLETGYKSGATGNWVRQPAVTVFTLKWKPFKKKITGVIP